MRLAVVFLRQAGNRGLQQIHRLLELPVANQGHGVGKHGGAAHLFSLCKGRGGARLAARKVADATGFGERPWRKGVAPDRPPAGAPCRLLTTRQIGCRLSLINPGSEPGDIRAAAPPNPDSSEILTEV